MSNPISRRDALKRGGLIAVGLVTPKWLSAITHGDLIRQAKGSSPATDTVLVVCQLSGGNDGLNTVVPYATKAYYDLRPTLAIKDDAVLKLNEHIGLHPALKPLHELYRERKVAIVQGVGYPRPNRSHFKSMEIWQSASPEGNLKYGWIGRHFDAQLAGGPLNPVVALGLSVDKPLALSARNAGIPCFASLTDIQTMVGDPDTEQMLRRIQGEDAKEGSAERLVQQANRTALDAMAILNERLGTYTPKQDYGTGSFGVGFQQIAQLVATSPQTRVVYFSTGGFDTHAQQATAHERLLSGFAQAVHAFQKEMEAIGRADKVIVLAFSEFGRRTFENASAGTDHGAAAPMFLVGSSVKGGIHGPNPDLQDLADGDVRFSIDFREVYATTLDKWMGGDSELVLGQKFGHVAAV